MPVSLAFADSPFRIVVTETETPLVPNSVVDLALRLGYYAKAGVTVDLVRVQQTPSAVAALSSGQGDMANIGFDTALQLVARDQLKLRGVVSPDKALPFVIAAKKEFVALKQLEGHVFGVARVGSVDYTLSRIVLGKMGADPDRLRYLSIGQPAVRMQSLLAGRIDATTISIGAWTSLPDKSGLSMLVDQAAYYAAAPFISKLNVVTADIATSKAAQVQAVVSAIIAASRDFAKNPALWVEAMTKARPDVSPDDLRTMAQAYTTNWSVNGGLNIAEAAFTTDIQYDKNADFQDLRRVPPAEWIDTRFIDATLAKLGTQPVASASR